MARKRRSAAQIAATRKMIAARRAQLRGRVRRRNPRHAPAVAVPNPAPRKRRWKRTSVQAASAAGRALRYRRRNPIGFDLRRFATDTLMPSVVGGAGAIGLDVLLGALRLPPALTVGPMRPVVRVGGAIGIGLIASMIAPRRMAEQMAAGALTVVMYDTLRGFLGRVTGGRVPGLGVYVDPMLGEMDPEAVSYYEAAQQVGQADDDVQVVGNVPMLPDEVGVYVD
jgi:hypothetical protein